MFFGYVWAEEKKGLNHPLIPLLLKIWNHKTFGIIDLKLHYMNSPYAKKW